MARHIADARPKYKNHKSLVWCFFRALKNAKTPEDLGYTIMKYVKNIDMMAFKYRKKAPSVYQKKSLLKKTYAEDRAFLEYISDRWQDPRRLAAISEMGMNIHEYIPKDQEIHKAFLKRDGKFILIYIPICRGGMTQAMNEKEIVPTLEDYLACNDMTFEFVSREKNIIYFRTKAK